MNSEELYRLYLQQLAEDQAGGRSGSLKDSVSKIGNYGENLSAIGDAINNNINNAVAQKLGSSMGKFGSSVSNAANSVSNALNAPKNYFKGFAKQKIGSGLNKAGQYLANKTGLANTIGNQMMNAGSALAGTGGAATGAATGASTAAGTAAGTTAGAAGAAGASAGAGAAASGAAAGSAAGGAAAGSAAGGAAAGGTSTAAAGGPIGALIALAAMAITGAHRNAAKKQSKQLLNSTNEAVNQESDEALAQSQQNTSQIQDAVTRALAKGVPTGGAANIADSNPDENGPTTKEAFADALKNVGWDEQSINSAMQGLNLGDKTMRDNIEAYNQYADDGQKIVIPQTDEEIANARAAASGTTPQGTQDPNAVVKRSLLDKFMSGFSDFSKGYQENKNNAFDPNNLSQKQFSETVEKPNENLVNYQNQLKQQGYDENTINAVAEGKNSGNKEIADWISKNQSALQPTTETVTTDKGKMARLGEFAGTIGRLAEKPGVQALIAGGLSTALTGNPLYGLGMAQKYAAQRQKTNAYKDALHKQGIDIDPGLFGTLTNTDFNSLMTPQYKDAANNIALAKLQETKNYHDMMMKYYQDKLDEQKNYHAGQVENGKIKANASMVRANKVGTSSGSKGGSGTKQSKPQNHPDWNKDLSQFATIATDPRYVKNMDVARSRFINKYGVDPIKFVKL